MSDAVPTALYRLFGENDALLYIGISDTFGRRWHEHAHSQPWWPEVRRQSIDWHPSREDAEREEALAVKAERPRFNKQHNVGARPQLPPLARPVHAVEGDARGGMAVRHSRDRRGLTQGAVAAKMTALGWKWHPGTVHRTEAGVRPLGYGEGVDLAEILGIPLSDFLLNWTPFEERGAA